MRVGATYAEVYEATVGAGAAPLPSELWKSIDDVIGRDLGSCSSA